MKNRHYTLIRSDGSRVVMIDRKISLRSQLMAGLKRFTDWFETGTGEDILVVSLLWGSALAIYIALAV